MRYKDWVNCFTTNAMFGISSVFVLGWMMWNWMVSALALGTTLVLYDGSPLHPHPATMWDLVDACGITIFGTSAKWIAVQEDRGIKPRLTHKLTSLKVSN